MVLISVIICGLHNPLSTFSTLSSLLLCLFLQLSLTVYPFYFTNIQYSQFLLFLLFFVSFLSIFFSCVKFSYIQKFKTFEKLYLDVHLRVEKNKQIDQLFFFFFISEFISVCDRIKNKGADVWWMGVTSFKSLLCFPTETFLTPFFSETCHRKQMKGEGEVLLKREVFFICKFKIYH